MEITEENSEKLWKIQKKIVKWYEKYGRKVGWIVKWYGRKVSWIVKRYEKYGRKSSWIGKWYGKYRRKWWKDTKNMEENCEMICKIWKKWGKRIGKYGRK